MRPVSRPANWVQKREKNSCTICSIHTAMSLSVNRTCIGAADSAAKVYSYDEGEADPG